MGCAGITWSALSPYFFFVIVFNFFYYNFFTFHASGLDYYFGKVSVLAKNNPAGSFLLHPHCLDFAMLFKLDHSGGVEMNSRAAP